MNRFTIPRDLYYGRGSLAALSSLPGSRAAVVVGGGSMERLGHLGRVEEYLRAAGMEVRRIEGVEPDPSVTTVLRGAAEMREFSPDLIVSIGGGSPIDAAKAMWVFYEYPETDFAALTVPFSFPTLRRRARFAAIPSTSGTASEVTAFSVITDYTTGVKYPLADFNITPDVAILDPDLADSMPAQLTAFTGMDALTHAIEAYVSTMHSPLTDPLALAAISDVLEFLPASYRGEGEARERMHYAQCLAGMAFSNALLGIVHSMAHKTGAAFSGGHVPHGCANAIYLPYVIRYNAREAAGRYAEISARVGLSDGGEPQKAVDALIDRIREYNSAFGIPASLREFGVGEEEYRTKREQIASLAVSDACTGTNPRKIDDAGMLRLLDCVYYGREVDF